MRSDKRILVAFTLNLLFSVIEFAGGVWTGSIAIASDALHDLGDAVGIGASYFFERKSKKQPDERYTYGYGRYSVLGGAVTLLILLLGSVAVIVGAVKRLVNPVNVNYGGMIIFAVLGVLVNLGAVLMTREGRSLNQRAVSLHMLEDVLGWAVVLVGAVVMRFTDLAVIDPLMSILVAVFILINVVAGLKEIVEIILEKAPDGIDVRELSDHLLV
ncbi:MAG: cation transporter, partial [Clostridia bacterium]|nr:cation transporter [Clostridia bacterium]